jgi:hypothetical protein
MSSNTYDPYLPVQASGSEQSQQPMSGKVHHEGLHLPIFDIENTHDAIMGGQIEVTGNQLMMHRVEQVSE